jgi:hypothetical protein
MRVWGLVTISAASAAFLSNEQLNALYGQKMDTLKDVHVFTQEEGM